jgi:hypothetical protein
LESRNQKSKRGVIRKTIRVGRLIKKKMKKIIYSLLSLFTLISCGNNSASIDIPSDLAKNEQVVIYFETFDKVISEYVGMIEELSEASKKNQTNQNIGDAMAALSSVANSTIKMAPLLEKLNALEQEGEIMKGNLTEQEVKSFVDTYSKMLIRVQEASLKIND